MIFMAWKQKKWQYVGTVIDALMDKYHYGFIRTPIFEETSLFHRGVGNTTDIVTKETYDFKDRGDRDMTPSSRRNSWYCQKLHRK